MKNATRHAEKLKSLYRTLTRGAEPAAFQPQEPLRALVRGAMTYDVPDARAEDAMKHIEREFVDLNELRVATQLEVHELLGTRYPAIEERVQLITRALNDIFEKEHTLSLDRLKTVAKRDARDFLRALLEMSPFVEAYVMLFAFEGHCVPVDHQINQFLIDEGVVEPGVSPLDTQKFLEHHLKVEECFPFYAGARAAAADGGRPRKKAKG